MSPMSLTMWSPRSIGFGFSKSMLEILTCTVKKNLKSGYKVKNDPTKLPSLKIYDLLEAGFDEVSDQEDDEIDERCRTSKILKVVYILSYFQTIFLALSKA